jgi:hypothetical protein
LPNATYQLKVCGIDNKGLDGAFAEQTLVVDIHPFAPVPKLPLDNANITRKKTLFVWEGSSEAHSYLLQVAAAADFNDLIVRVEGLPAAIDSISVKLPAGNYHWRIAAINADKEQGPFSLIHNFTVVAKR